MIVDAHVHIFPPAIVSGRAGYLERDLTFRTLYSHARARMATADELVASMDHSGIDVSVLANIGWATHELCQETNDYLLEAASRYPKRLVPFCAVNPTAGDRAVEEVERCARLGARGVGELHPDYQGFDLGDRAVMAPVMEAAARRGMVVLTHASEPVGHQYSGKGMVTPDVLYRFVGHFPESPIVLAHWGGGLPFYALMPEVRKALANVWVDTAASPFLYDPAIFETVARLIGAEKVLLATDFPLITPQRVLTQVEQAALSPEAKGLILGGNAVKVFRLQ